ncbi:PspC domain-containing protein [Pseudonocardia sp. TRM90224]|uniref:PspC domain-containing protein n=1 Tax=Pseudonocardia sp. TRM90224 TaxID=2812678 RepID=UPI001E5205C8|nr:PspC domain-containing protein [Pseudonocardia sp. TRM90224]
METNSAPAGPSLEKDAAAATTVIDPALAPVPAQAPAKKFRLHRSRTDKMLGGVCGGLAESLGVDSTLIRIGLFALTVLGVGTGVVVYVAIWALAPEGEED